MKALFYVSVLMLTFSHTSIAKTKPHHIQFNQDETVNAALSSRDMNRILVQNDKIQNVTCPAQFCTIAAKKTDKSGAVLVSLNTSAPFVMYVTTKKGSNFGVFVTPRAKPSVTTIFSLDSNQKTLKSFDENMPYTRVLSSFMKSLILWSSTPNHLKKNIEGYQLNVIPSDEQDDLIDELDNDGLLNVPIAIFSGTQLSGTIYRVINDTDEPIDVLASDFYQKGVRAASLNKNVIEPSSEGRLFVIHGREY